MSVPFWRGRFPCTLRRRSTYSTEGMCHFPRPLWVSLLCKAFNRDNFPKTRAAKKNPCWLHFMASSTSILSLVFADEAANGAKSEWSSIGPAFVELRALTRTLRAWKIPTHTSGSRRPSFSVFDAPSSPRTWKLKTASLHYFRRPCHHLKVAVPWFSSALRFSIVVSCNLQAEASVTGRGRAATWSISKEVFFFFFFGIFGKKLRARVTRNKENNNSGP